MRGGQRARGAPEGQRGRRRGGGAGAGAAAAAAAEPSAPTSSSPAVSTSERGASPDAGSLRKRRQAHHQQEVSEGRRGPVRGCLVDLGVDDKEARGEVPQDRSDVALLARASKQPHLDRVLHAQGGLDDGVLCGALGLDAQSVQGGASDDRRVVCQVVCGVEPPQGVVPGDGRGLGGLAGGDARGLTRHASGDIGDGGGDVGRLVEGLDDDGMTRRRRRSA